MLNYREEKCVVITESYFFDEKSSSSEGEATNKPFQRREPKYFAHYLLKHEMKPLNFWVYEI